MEAVSVQALTEEVRRVMHRHTSGRLASIAAVDARPEGTAVTAATWRACRTAPTNSPTPSRPC